MAEDFDAGARRTGTRLAVLALAGIAAIFLTGGAVGFTAAHLDKGGGWSPVLLIPLAVLLAAAGLLAWAWRRFAQARAAAPDLRGPKERANHRLLAVSGAIGGAIGLAMAIGVLSQPRDGMMPDMINGTLPAGLAVALALVWAATLPAIAWRWHGVVDEHEREAYRDGAVAGFYVVGAGAPVWWFLWRGQLLPPLDPFWLYVATMTAAGVVWAWRKYR